MLNLDISQIIVQIIGFLVMLWVIKRYGWLPLLEVLKTRQDRIQAEMESISAQKDKVNDLVLQYEEKLKNIEVDSRKKIQEAVEEGQKMSIEIQENAQIKAKEILRRVKEEVEEEALKAKNQLKIEMVNLVMDVTLKILKEDLNPLTQKKLITNFIEEAQMK